MTKKQQNPEIKRDLLRICVLSFFLSIGYMINFKSVLDTILLGKKDLKSPSFEVWEITYLSSCIWLFIACVIMTIITLFGFKIQLLLTNNSDLAIYLFLIGAFAHGVSIVLATVGTNNGSDIIHWENELLYSLLSLYLLLIIYFFQRLKSCTKLILLSTLVFITPCIRLVSIVCQLIGFKMGGNGPNLMYDSIVLDKETILQISAFASMCTATSVLIAIHIGCALKYFNSGLAFKLTIIASFGYALLSMMAQRLDFEKYDSHSHSTDRIYYYYALLSVTYVMYCVEIFIELPNKIIKKHVEHRIRARPSFDLNVERLEIIQAIRSSGVSDVLTLKGLFDLQKKHQKKQIWRKSAKCFAQSQKLNNNSAIAMYNIPNVYNCINPNETIEAVMKIFPDRKPCKRNCDKYFAEFDVCNDKRIKDSIAAIVPFYNESANQIHATLRTLYQNWEYIKTQDARYKFTHFNVLLVGDGWFKMDISTKKYLAKLYNVSKGALDFEKGKHNTVILQTKHNKKVCINPFNNDEQKLFLKVTTIIKIDNRKKANSHEWFLGKYGFAEWAKCDYMFFTDAYSTMNREGLYRMMGHMKEECNKDVVCCTGRARVYTIEQELEFARLVREVPYIKQKRAHKWWQNEIFTADDDESVSVNIEIESEEVTIDDEEANVVYKIQDIEYDHRLTTNAHLRACQQFEFESLYGTIGCFLLGGFLPVIPGPCGFYRSQYILMDEVRGWYFQQIEKDSGDDLVLGNMKLAEDRILTISSILNCHMPVRHSLITECVFYFDPMPDLMSLMKQRRRWLNGSIAMVLFILRKISFQGWNVNIFRKYYILTTFYMQLFMFFILLLSPALMFTVSVDYGLQNILRIIFGNEANNEAKWKKINTISNVFVFLAWASFIIFIYFAQSITAVSNKKKKTVMAVMLKLSHFWTGLILIGTVIVIANANVNNDSSSKDISQYSTTKAFEYGVVIIQCIFLAQSFILAPLVSKDIETLKIICKTFLHYYFYSAFYVIFFFINAIANTHDLTWGTRPDSGVSGSDAKQRKGKRSGATQPKYVTLKILCLTLFMNVILGITVRPFTGYIFTHMVFFGIITFPAGYQIFFSLVWLVNTRMRKLFTKCKPSKIKAQIEYIGLVDFNKVKGGLDINGSEESESHYTADIDNEVKTESASINIGTKEKQNFIIETNDIESIEVANIESETIETENEIEISQTQNDEMVGIEIEAMKENEIGIVNENEINEIEIENGKEELMIIRTSEETSLEIEFAKRKTLIQAEIDRELEKEQSGSGLSMWMR